MADTQTLYKLIILYMLNKVEFPLTNTQISNLVLEKEYTTYFVLQQAFSQLLEMEFITAGQSHHNTLYRITPKGKETLSLFSDKISKEIKDDINEYLTENKFALKEEVSYFADYFRTSGAQYAVRCYMKDDGRTKLELTLTVPTKEMAEAICTNWRKKEQDVYAYLLDLLVQ